MRAEIAKGGGIARRGLTRRNARHATHSACVDVLQMCRLSPATTMEHAEEALRALTAHRAALEKVVNDQRAKERLSAAAADREEAAAPACEPEASPERLPVDDAVPTAPTSWADEAASPEPAAAAQKPPVAAWQEPKNWGAILTPQSNLYAKFLSPDRMRKTPQETKRLAMAKQARAEAFREQQREAKVARAAARRNTAEHAARLAEEEHERLRVELEERDRRKHELRQAHIEAVAQRAGDENRKVEEVAFVGRLDAENKRLATQQKLDEAQERRAKLEDERRQRAMVDSASEDASERRQRIEEERRKKAALNKERREEALTKLEEERKAAREAAETRNTEARLAAEAHAAREAQLAEERAQKLRRRLLEAELRRTQYIVEVRSAASSSRGTASGGESPSTPPTPSAAAGHPPGSPLRQPPTGDGLAPDSPSRAAGRTAAAAEAAEAAAARIKSSKKRMKKLRARSDGLAAELAPELSELDLTEAPALIGEIAADIDKASAAARTLDRLKRSLSELRRGRTVVAEEAAAELARALKLCVPKSADQLRMLHAARGAGLLRWLAETLADPALPSEKAIERARLLKTCCAVPGNCVYLVSNNLLMPVLGALVSCLDLYNESSDTILEGDDVDEASAAAFISTEELLHEMLNLFARALRHCGSGGGGEAPESSYPDAGFMEASALASLRAKGLQQLESDLVSAVVAAGVVHRLHDLFVLCVKPGLPATSDAAPALAPIPAVVLDGLTLMEVLAVPRGPKHEGREVQGCAKAVLDEMKDTALGGLPSLVTAVLLHASPKDAASAVATLPPNFAPAASAVCRVLCDLTRLHLPTTRELFLSPDLRIEIYHLLSFLLAFCASAESDATGAPKQHAVATLRNAAIVLVGSFACLGKECQDMLVWGKTPTILSRLASLPYPYLCDPMLRSVLLPTLVAACFRHPSNANALESSGFGGDVLRQFIEEEASLEDAGAAALEPHAALGLAPPPRPPTHLSLSVRFSKHLWPEAARQFGGGAGG